MNTSLSVFGQTNARKTLLEFQTSAFVSTQQALNTNIYNVGFNFQVATGKFIKDNFAYGIILGYEHFNPDAFVGNWGRGSSNIFNFGVFARYYFTLKNEKFKPFLDINTRFTPNQPIAELEYFGGKERVFSTHLGAGLAYFISEKASLNIIVPFSYERKTMSATVLFTDSSGQIIAEDIISDFNELGVNMLIGFQLYL
jgi:outer membrane protein W